MRPNVPVFETLGKVLLGTFALLCFAFVLKGVL